LRMTSVTTSRAWIDRYARDTIYLNGISKPWTMVKFDRAQS